MPFSPRHYKPLRKRFRLASSARKSAESDLKTARKRFDDALEKEKKAEAALQEEESKDIYVYFGNTPNTPSHSKNYLRLSYGEQKRRILRAMNDKATVIYYNNYWCKWQYFLKGHPEEIPHREMENIREGLLIGSVKEVKAGENFVIDGMLEGECLYTILVKFSDPDKQCPSWMMLRQRGLLDDMQWTPYLFAKSDTRDAFLSRINEPVAVGQIVENPAQSISFNNDLEDVERAMNAQAALIYYNHTVSRWCYFDGTSTNFKSRIRWSGISSFYCWAYRYIDMDKSSLGVETRSIRDWLINGLVKEVKQGETFVINGRNIFPLLVKFQGLECPSWMQLRQTGSKDDLQWTPYLFADIDVRDDTLHYITMESEGQYYDPSDTEESEDSEDE